MNSISQATTTRTLLPTGLPDWVPTGALRYLAHTECGLPIRELARAADCHASTVLRQIRKVEARRDDPLVDSALRQLGTAMRQPTDTSKGPGDARAKKDAVLVFDKHRLRTDGIRILRRLCETGALLAVAAEMDKAVVIRDAGSATPTRTAVLETALAQAMALKGWIAPGNTGRIVRYHITGPGRAALARFLKADEKTKGKQAEAAPLPPIPQDNDAPRARAHRRMRYCLVDSPLIALARRRDRDGSAFLSDTLVHAGERLREDFELAQMDTAVTQNWEGFLTAGTSKGHRSSGQTDAPSEARARVAAALAALGPGLSEIALHCCCYLEGLETTEKRLGWSARSGKIVLRIALMRLARYYDGLDDHGGPLIG